MFKSVVITSVAACSLAGMALAGTGNGSAGSFQSLAADEGAFQMAQSCSSGLSVCAAGSYGPGGCFKPGYATCTAGLVCTGGMVVCAPTNGAAPYCYKPSHGKCN